MLTHKRTLRNGLRLVAVQMPHLHSAEVAIYIKVGGRNDSREKAGISHFVEHMLFRGTSDFPTNLELEKAFENIGGSVNAATDAETTCYYSRLHPAKIEEGLRLFSSMILRPTLGGMEVEKRIISEEALEDINERGEEINPDNLASRLLWPQHPLGMPTVGFLDTIATFTEEDVRRHLEQFYLASNSVIVAVGPIQPDTFFAAAEATFGNWNGGTVPASALVKVVQNEPELLFVKNSTSQVDLQVAFRSFARSDRRMPALRLLRRILSGGGSSRLYLSLRERLGIIYSVDAAISAFDDAGNFSVDLSCAPENLPLAVEEVLKESLRLVREPVPSEELLRVRQSYIYDLEYSQDSTYEMHVRYGWGEIMGMVRHIEDDRRETEEVTAQDVQDTARAIFTRANLNLVTVGPWSPSVRRQVEERVGRFTAI